jgi:hypothetical protein
MVEEAAAVGMVEAAISLVAVVISLVEAAISLVARKAISWFQSVDKLSVTGRIDDPTLKALQIS